MSERADGRTGEEWVRESGGCRVVDLEAVRRQKEEEQGGEEAGASPRSGRGRGPEAGGEARVAWKPEEEQGKH